MRFRCDPANAPDVSDFVPSLRFAVNIAATRRTKMSVHKKLMQARIMLQKRDLKKSGQNKFAGYSYFELADFIFDV